VLGRWFSPGEREPDTKGLQVSQPTPEQIAKLPKWAQEHIEDKERQRFVAQRRLDELVDSTTPSPFWHESNDCTGPNNGVQHKKHFVQAHSRFCVEYAGVHLEIVLRDHRSMELQWTNPERGCGELACVPESFQKVRLITRKNLRA
jgi:hypothetical protein